MIKFMLLLDVASWNEFWVIILFMLKSSNGDYL